MGFGDSNLADNGRSRSEDAVGEASSKGITCSICLEHVSVGGDRSTASLRCGHQFHLDCVGSAFNYISTMQCPNCRQVEKGNWQFASGLSLSVPEFSVDDFIADEEIFDLNYPDLQRAGGVHFCPYRLGRFPFSYEDSDYTSPIPRYGEDEWSRYNGQIAENLSSPLYYRSFDPYSTQNIHRHPPPPASSASQVPNPWNNIPMPSIDSSNPVTFPAVDDPHHHQTWDSLSQYINHHSNGNEAMGSSTHVRAPTRLRSDVSGITQMQMHSLVSNLRNLSSSASSSPQYMENSHGHVARHENNGGSYTPNIQTSTAVRHGRMEQMFPPSEYSGFYNNNRRTRRHENTEINMGSNNNRHYQWERDLLAPFPLLPVEGDFSYWDRLPLMTTGTTAPPPLDSGSNMFTSLWSQHYNGSQRNAAPSSNQPQPPTPPPPNINTSHQSDLQHFL